MVSSVGIDGKITPLFHCLFSIVKIQTVYIWETQMLQIAVKNVILFEYSVFAEWLSWGEREWSIWRRLVCVLGAEQTLKPAAWLIEQSAPRAGQNAQLERMHMKFYTSPRTDQRQRRCVEWAANMRAGCFVMRWAPPPRHPPQLSQANGH